MGCCASLCGKTPDSKIVDQYENLMVSKPAPISLEALQNVSSDTDVPLFPEVDSDDDGDKKFDSDD
jgi:hypothetical protein